MVAVMLLTAATWLADARVISSRTVGERSKTDTEWIIRTGVSIDGGVGSAKSEYNDWCTDGGDYGSGSFGMAAGYELSFGFNRAFSRAGGLYWGMELGLGTRGIKYKLDSEYDSGTQKLLTWNIKYSPFTFGYKFALNQNIKLDAHLGAYLSYDFAGTGKANWKDSDGDSDSDSAGIGDDEYFEGFQRFDAGIQAGVGVWYKRFNFDITYQRGFVNACNFEDNYDLDEIDGKIYSSNLMFRVGIAF